MNYNDLREVCTSKKISIKELTEQIGYSRQGLQSALDNQTIELRKLKKLCEFIGIEPMDFFVEFERLQVNSPVEPYYNSQLLESKNREIKLLEKQIEDKEEIIKLLKEKSNK